MDVIIEIKDSFYKKALVERELVGSVSSIRL